MLAKKNSMEMRGDVFRTWREVTSRKERERKRADVKNLQVFVP